MKADWTINSHHITHTFVLECLGEFVLWAWESERVKPLLSGHQMAAGWPFDRVFTILHSWLVRSCVQLHGCISWLVLSDWDNVICVADAHEEDEKNLVYVAVTRAKKRLMMTRTLLQILAEKKVNLKRNRNRHFFLGWSICYSCDTQLFVLSFTGVFH